MQLIDTLAHKAFDMKIYAIALFLLFSIGLEAQTYVRNFEATVHSSDVGYTTAKKTVTGDVVQYDIKSVVSIEVLFTISIVYNAQASYKGGVLISSSASVHVNGHLQRSVVTEKVGDYYKIVSDEHETKLYKDIPYSTAKMYFNEPTGVTSVYSESEGIMKTMVKTSDGKYKVKDAQNDENSTTYGYSSEQGVNNILVIKEHMPDLILKQVRVLPTTDKTD